MAKTTRVDISVGIDASKAQSGGATLAGAVNNVNDSLANLGKGGNTSGRGVDAAVNVLNALRQLDAQTVATAQNFKTELPKGFREALGALQQLSQSLADGALSPVISSAVDKRNKVSVLQSQQKDMETLRASLPQNPTSQEDIAKVGAVEAELARIRKEYADAIQAVNAEDQHALEVSKQAAAVARKGFQSISTQKRAEAAEEKKRLRESAKDQLAEVEQRRQLKAYLVQMDAEEAAQAAKSAQAKADEEARYARTVEESWGKLQRENEAGRKKRESDERASNAKSVKEREAEMETKVRIQQKLDKDEEAASKRRQKAAEQEKRKGIQALNELSSARIKAFNKLQGTINGVMATANRFWNGIRQMAQGIQELSLMLSLSVMAPIAMVFKEGIASAMTFEAQITKIRKAADIKDKAGNLIGGYDVDDLAGAFRRLSKITPTSIEQITTFGEQAAQAGIQGVPAIYRFVNLMNKVTIGTDVMADSVAEDFARIGAAWNFNLSSDKGLTQLENLASAMDYIAKRTATNMEGMITAMKDAGTIGSTLKIPAEQVALLSAAMISAGVDATGAGTDMVRFYNAVMKAGGAKKFSDAMKNMFPEYGSAEGVMKVLNEEGGAVKVLVDALKMLNMATDKEKAQALANYFGFSGQVGGKSAAMMSQLEKIIEMQDAIAKGQHVNTLQDDYTAMLLTTENQTKILQNNWKDLGITVGTYILPTINKLLQYAIPAIEFLADGFGALDDKTKLLIIAVPLITAAIIPVVGILATLLHVLGLVSAGAVNVVWVTLTGAVSAVRAISAIGSGLAGLLGAIGKLGGAAAATTAAATQGAAAVAGAAAEGTAAVAAGASAATAGIATIGTVLSSIGAIIAGVAVAFVGLVAGLGAAGVDLGNFFLGIAKNAKSWGENLMKTYGQGLITGAAKWVADAIAGIASIIAGFFEAHSPPDEGPLATIDQWGRGLMNTYLRGFKLADFDILSEIGNRIKSALEIDMNNAAGGDDITEKLNQIFAGVRENLSSMVDIFNRTGQLAEGMFASITGGTGILMPDLQKLVKLWFEYKVLQEKIADLERRKKNTLKTYDQEIARISQLNVSAEEKAELIRQAMMGRDGELRAIEVEKTAQEELAEAKKEELDWQKAFIDAQLEQLELLKKVKKESSGSGSESNMYEVLGGALNNLNNGENPLEKFTEEANRFKDKLIEAKTVFDSFLAGFNGEDLFWKDWDSTRMDDWERWDPKGFAAATGQDAQDAFKWGQEIGKIFEDIKTKVEEIGNSDFVQVITGKKKISNPLDAIFGGGQQQTSSFFNGKQAGPAYKPVDKAFSNVMSTSNAASADTLAKALGRLNTELERMGKLFSGVGIQLPKFDAGMLFATNVAVPLTMAISFVTNVLGLLANVLGIAIGLFDDIVETFTLAASVFDSKSMSINDKANAILGLLFALIISVIGSVAGFLASAASAILTWLGETALSITKGFGELWNIDTTDAETFIQGLIDTFAKLPEDVLKGFDDIRTAILDLLGLYAELEDATNAAIKAGVETYNNASGSGYGGADNDPSTPFARGGVATGPTRALIGEAGPEVVLPLSKLPDMFQDLYGSEMAGRGDVITIQINNPVVRDDKDIQKIAREVEKVLAKKTKNSMTMGVQTV